MSEPEFYNVRDENGRRLVSEFVAERDDTQVRTARKEKDAVFSHHIIGWRTLWAEAHRVKESYGRHPSVRELLEFFLEDAPDVPKDEVELRFNITLQSIEDMGLVVRSMGTVDGRFCQVLANIKSPKTTNAVNLDEEVNNESQKEQSKVNLDTL